MPTSVLHRELINTLIKNWQCNTTNYIINSVLTIGGSPPKIPSKHSIKVFSQGLDPLQLSSSCSPASAMPPTVKQRVIPSKKFLHRWLVRGASREDTNVTRVEFPSPWWGVMEQTYRTSPHSTAYTGSLWWPLPKKVKQRSEWSDFH